MQIVLDFAPDTSRGSTSRAMPGMMEDRLGFNEGKVDDGREWEDQGVEACEG